ncbi:MAG: iron-containing alcohol dehydrogenase [Firmicutes bacterium]|nr:iron-containing alcohol dehydrogenase [Bacillota bacterium]
MQNFMYYVPTKIHFGTDQLGYLSELKESGSKVLLVYGGGSIKRSGLYDAAMKVLVEAGLEIFECAGVEPNPRIQTVRRGVEICKENKIDMVLAIGGGSTIDCAKVIAAGAVYEGNAWDLVINPPLIKAALPIYSVLTLSATGSEMDAFAVISDLTKNEKWGTASDCMKPKMSILDPTLTYTVSKKQTAAGTADMMSHTFENYFNFVEGSEMQAGFAESILRCAVKYGPIALEDPTNYDARASLMWCASFAINGTLNAGCAAAWCVHPMEHELSAFYDITHGEGLAILTPVWMEYILSEKTAPRIAQFGRNVMNVTEKDDMAAAKEAIAALKTFFFETMGLPANLRAVGIVEKDNFEVMAQKAANGCVGSYVPLSKEDIVEIFNRAF